MKQKRIILIVVGMAVLCAVPISVARYSDSKQDNHIVQNDIDKKDIYLQGRDAVITNEDIAAGTRFYQETGLSGEEAKEKAVQYFKEYEALYAEAERKGYTATEQEIEDYLKELRENMTGSDVDEVSKEEYEAAVKGFDSEDDYWEHEKEVYKKTLPIQKMVSDLEETFSTDPSLQDQEWDTYFETYKASLVEKENYL